MRKKSEENKTTLEKEHFLIRLILNRLKKEPKNQSVILSFSELSKYPYFTDPDLVERTSALLKDELGSEFSYKILRRSEIISVDGTRAESPYAVKFYVDNKLALEKYTLGVESSLAKLTKPNEHFLLDGIYLFHVGNKGEGYKMVASAYTYKILRHLAEEKKPISTEELASRFTEGDLDRVRKTIGQIRDRAVKKFKVSRDSVIQNTPDIGYSFSNVEIKN